MKSIKALLYTVDGSITSIAPNNGTDFSLEELQFFIRGAIEIVYLPCGKIMVVHGEGKLLGFEKNEKATKVWEAAFPIEEYPENNGQLVVGDVVICDKEMVK